MPNFYHYKRNEYDPSMLLFLVITNQASAKLKWKPKNLLLIAQASSNQVMGYKARWK
jgi:hypothetical protein